MQNICTSLLHTYFHSNTGHPSPDHPFCFHVELVRLELACLKICKVAPIHLLYSIPIAGQLGQYPKGTLSDF